MMKRFFLLLGLFCSLGSLSLGAQTGTKTPDLGEIVNGHFSARGAGYGVRSMPDGEHYTLISADGSAVVRYRFATGQAVDTLFSVKRARECHFDRFDDYTISADGHHVLIYTDREPIYRRSSRSNLYHYDVRRNLIAPLSQGNAKVMIPTFSPDSRMVAFVRDGNIFIKKLDFDTEVQVTTDGRFNHIMNGTTDWVYEEEFTTTKLMSWSEDSEYLAFVKTDESAVKQYEMPMYGRRLYPQDYTYKYPKAGEDNSKVSVHVYNVKLRSQKPVVLPSGTDYYIPRLEFVGRDGNLAIFTLNRLQNHFRLFYVNYKTLLPKLVFQEQEDAYVDSEHIQSLTFTPSGFAYLSERDGYAHLYLFSDKGQLQRQVTKGAYDVTAFYGIDRAGRLYYQSAEASPMERTIYAIDTKGRKELLGQRGGTNNAVFSNGFTYFIGSHSTINDPTHTALYRTLGNKALRTLQDNAPLKARLVEHRFAPKEFIKVATKSFGELNGWILRPANFDAQRKYPVVMVQYSGPNSQQVLDRYGFGWEYYLASQGFVVACVDGPGTGARGEAWRKQTYLELGMRESQGQIEAAHTLGRLPYVDASRMAIWGWSFGGYNTLMSLCHGAGTFKVGIAVAPVTDWGYYDTIYTERYMRTPKENPKGYKISSVLEVADKLQGKLLLIHGSADDNVHVQNSMDLVEQFVRHDKQFDMMIYTDRDHSIRGGNTSKHIYTKMVDYLRTHL